MKRILDRPANKYKCKQTTVQRRGANDKNSGERSAQQISTSTREISGNKGTASHTRDGQKAKTIHFNKTTEGPPVTGRPKRLPPGKYSTAKKEFEGMVKEGIARPSKSNWSSPLHVVQKRDGNLRPCGDYRALNARTIPDCYPVPHIEDFAQTLHGKKVFCTIDLVKACHQIPVNPEDIPKTPITTPFGLFEFP